MSDNAAGAFGDALGAAIARKWEEIQQWLAEVADASEALWEEIRDLFRGWLRAPVRRTRVRWHQWDVRRRKGARVRRKAARANHGKKGWWKE